ncbi:hypothetical protein Mgra_00005511, partial [Meloidogyne graminicola]
KLFKKCLKRKEKILFLIYTNISLHFIYNIYESPIEKAEFERKSEEAKQRMSHGYEHPDEFLSAKDEEGKEMAGEAFEEIHHHHHNNNKQSHCAH